MLAKELAVAGLLIAIFAQCGVCSPPKDTLLVTNVVFRHGDRAATHSLPIDAYNESFWPYGWGELTDRGKRQQYRLGMFFRDRYDKILDDKFNYKKIEIRSSDRDRCLVSAYSNLAGLYTNSTEVDDFHLPFVSWQPLPVHTTPIVSDEILAMNRPCKKAKQSTADLFNGPKILQMNKDYAEFFKLLSSVTGEELSENGFRDVWRIPDTLFCENMNGAPLPDWTNNVNVTCNGNTDLPCENKTAWQILREMSDYQFYVMYNSTILHTFDGGPLLEDIANKFELYVANNRTVTFNMYSAHDTTVAATLSALGVFDKRQPQYTAAVMIELHKSYNILFTYEVKVFYKPITDSATVIPMELPGCPSPCSLASFKTLIDKYKITDWDKECGNVSPLPISTSTAPPDYGLTQEEVVVITICGSVVLMLAFAAAICYFKRNRISSRYIAMS